MIVETRANWEFPSGDEKQFLIRYSKIFWLFIEFKNLFNTHKHFIKSDTLTNRQRALSLKIKNKIPITHIKKSHTSSPLLIKLFKILSHACLSLQSNKRIVQQRIPDNARVLVSPVNHSGIYATFSIGPTVRKSVKTFVSRFARPSTHELK